MIEKKANDALRELFAQPEKTIQKKKYEGHQSFEDVKNRWTRYDGQELSFDKYIEDLRTLCSSDNFLNSKASGKPVGSAKLRHELLLLASLLRIFPHLACDLARRVGAEVPVAATIQLKTVLGAASRKVEIPKYTQFPGMNLILCKY